MTLIFLKRNPMITLSLSGKNVVLYDDKKEIKKRLSFSHIRIILFQKEAFALFFENLVMLP